MKKVLSTIPQCPKCSKTKEIKQGESPPVCQSLLYFSIFFSSLFEAAGPSVVTACEITSELHGCAREMSSSTLKSVALWTSMSGLD